MEVSENRENLERLIIQWYDLASGRRVDESTLSNVYFQFMALWVAFNALYDSRPWAYGKRDRDQVILFSKQDSEARARHQKLMQHDDEYSEAIYYLKEHQEEVRCKLEDEQELEDVLLCVYRVRNNLFHARKLYGNPLDEDLVKHSYKIVLELMLVEPYLNVGSAPSEREG